MFLVAYKLTRDPALLARAERFSEFAWSDKDLLADLYGYLLYVIRTP